MRRSADVRNARFASTPVRMLDIGCADGSFMQLVRESISGIQSIDGVDVPSRWSEKGPDANLGKRYLQDLQQGTGQIPENNFHIITFWEVIEHIENVPAFLRNISKLLVPGGVILLSSPNLLGLSRFVKGSRWVGTTEQDHKYLFDKLSMQMILSRNGFKEVDVRAYFLPSIGKGADSLNQMLSVLPGGGMLFAQAVKN